MSTQEYYIRNASETEARGPFTLEQLTSLAENGQATPETFYYDAATEAWTPINANSALLATLFPAKKSLRVRAKDAAQVKPLNVVTEQDRAITVNDMLLAAEGRTAETKGSADPKIARGRAAGIGALAAALMLLVTGLAFALPGIDVLTALDVRGIFQQPLIVLGVLYVLLAGCIGLGAVNTYPFIRFVAMLGFGFAASLFYFDNQLLLVAYAAATALGIFLCTVLLNLPAVIIVALIGLLGSAGLAQHFFTT